MSVAIANSVPILQLEPGFLLGDISLTSQADIDAFCYDEVTGNVTVSGNDIVDLSPLKCLTSIGGSLIFRFTALSDMQGLSSLEAVGGNLVIGDLMIPNHFKSLRGLSSLTTVGGDLIISNTDQLEKIDGLSRLTSIGGSLVIGGYKQENLRLTSLEGLSALSSVGEDLIISANPNLLNIDGLFNLSAVGGNVQIGGLRQTNHLLKSLDGLCGLISMQKDLIIEENPSLPHINGLLNLKIIGGDLRIGGSGAHAVVNRMLSNLDGLSRLEFVGGSVVIQNNPLLSGFSGLDPLLTHGVIGGKLSLAHNGKAAKKKSLGIALKVA